MDKTITLKQVGFYCDGQAKINLWGGGQTIVDMTPWTIDTDDEEKIIQGINDGQFGCESIEFADVNIYELYQYGVKIPHETMWSLVVEKEQLTKAKKGI